MDVTKIMHWVVLAIPILTSIVGVMSMIAALTPTKKDDSIVAFLGKIVNWLAFNFGHAKNKDQ